MFGGGLPGSFHNDVLTAEPTDEASKGALVEELKKRAKGSLSSKNYPEAVQLYSKAIEVYPTDSILYANRSMCYLNMNNADAAFKDAEQATALDPAYAKGFYRKGMALIKLNRLSDAKDAFLQGIALVPDDKEFRIQLDKLSATGVASSSRVSSSTSSATSVCKPAGSKSKPDAAVASEEADKDDEELGGVVRGYKKTSDGKVTTFFNNELDESTKALIGNIAPKKLTDVDPVAVVAPSVTASGSAWNAAGMCLQ